MRRNVNVFHHALRGKVEVSRFGEVERLLDVVGGAGDVQTQGTHLSLRQTSTDLKGKALQVVIESKGWRSNECFVANMVVCLLVVHVHDQRHISGPQGRDLQRWQ